MFIVRVTYYGVIDLIYYASYCLSSHLSLFYIKLFSYMHLRVRLMGSEFVGMTIHIFPRLLVPRVGASYILIHHYSRTFENFPIT